MRRLKSLLVLLCFSLQPGPATAAPLPVDEIAPGVFVHQGVHEEFGDHYHGDIANIGFVIGDAAVAVIDSGGSYRVGAALREAIRARTDKPIRYVINTHVHSDHIFGNAAFEPDGPEFIGHAQLPRAMRLRAETYEANLKTMLGEAAQGSRVVLPTQTIATERVIDLVNDRTRVRAKQSRAFVFAARAMMEGRPIDQGLDGDVAFDTAADGASRRLPGEVAQRRRMELMANPIVAVRTALDTNSRVTNRRTEGGATLVDIVTAAGERFTLAVAASTGLPLWVRWVGPHVKNSARVQPLTPARHLHP